MMTRLLPLVLFLGITVNSFAQERPDYITENTASFILEVDGLGKVEGELRIARSWLVQ